MYYSDCYSDMTYEEIQQRSPGGMKIERERTIIFLKQKLKKRFTNWGYTFISNISPIDSNLVNRRGSTEKRFYNKCRREYGVGLSENIYDVVSRKHFFYFLFDFILRAQFSVTRIVIGYENSENDDAIPMHQPLALADSVDGLQLSIFQSEALVCVPVAKDVAWAIQNEGWAQYDLFRIDEKGQHFMVVNFDQLEEIHFLRF